MGLTPEVEEMLMMLEEQRVEPKIILRPHPSFELLRKKRTLAECTDDARDKNIRMLKHDTICRT